MNYYFISKHIYFWAGSFFYLCSISSSTCLLNGFVTLQQGYPLIFISITKNEYLKFITLKFLMSQSGTIDQVIPHSILVVIAFLIDNKIVIWVSFWIELKICNPIVSLINDRWIKAQNWIHQQINYYNILKFNRPSESGINGPYLIPGPYFPWSWSWIRIRM